MRDINEVKLIKLLKDVGELVVLANPAFVCGGHDSGYLVPTEIFIRVANGLCDLGGPEVVCPECVVKNEESH